MAPDSSSSRIWKRACWPPLSDSKRLLAGVRQLVAVEHPGRLLAAHAGAAVRRAVAAVQDLQQRAADQLGVLVGLHEPARPHPRTELGLARVQHRLDLDVADRPVLDVGVAAAGRQEPEEVGLARAVGAQHGHPLAVPDLEVEGLHQPGQLEVLAHDGTLAGAAALEPHRHLLLAGLLGRRSGLLELAQPGLGGAVLRRHPVVVLGLDLVVQHELLDLGVLLVPALAELLEAGEAVAARLVVRREAARMGPHRVARMAELDGDHPGRGVVEQLAVVADHQDRLVRLADPPLEPDLAGDVEVVVRLVEQQHLVGPAQQELEHQALLLAAGEGAAAPVLRAVVGKRERGHRADVPGDLDVVAAGVGELRERVGVGHLGLLVVGLHQRELAAVDLGGGRADPRRRDAEQQVGDRRVVAEPGADHLAHHPEPAGAGHRAGVRRQLAGDDPQQRRLAGAVGADQRDLGALADAERHVVEQHPAVRQLVPHPCHVHMSHVGGLSAIAGLAAIRFCRAAVRTPCYVARCDRRHTTPAARLALPLLGLTLAAALLPALSEPPRPRRAGIQGDTVPKVKRPRPDDASPSAGRTASARRP